MKVTAKGKARREPREPREPDILLQQAAFSKFLEFGGKRYRVRHRIMRGHNREPIARVIMIVDPETNTLFGYGVAIRNPKDKAWDPYLSRIKAAGRLVSAMKRGGASSTLIFKNTLSGVISRLNYPDNAQMMALLAYGAVDLDVDDDYLPLGAVFRKPIDFKKIFVPGNKEN